MSDLDITKWILIAIIAIVVPMLTGALAVDLVRNQSSAWADRIECHTDLDCSRFGGNGDPE